MRKDLYEQLERLFHTTEFPEVDVKQKVMSAIYQKQAEKEEKKVKKKIGLLVTIGVLVGASTALAASQLIQLKDDTGEVVYQVQKMENHATKDEQLPPNVVQEEQQRAAERERVMKIVNEIEDGLAPGKAAAVYVVPKLPKPDHIQYAPGVRPDIWVVSKEFIFSRMDDLQAKLAKKIPLPAELLGQYHFAEAHLTLQKNDHVDDTAMREEAKANHKEFVVREVSLTDKLDRLDVYYKGSKGNVTLQIDNFESLPGMLLEGSEHESAEKVILGVNEAIYRVWNATDNSLLTQNIIDNGTIAKSISWIKNGTKLRYNLAAHSKDITKEELVKLAERIVQEK